jgi:hypothetical protein
MPKAIALAEIEQIFAILDELGISREAVVIPLRPAGSGGVSRGRDGRIEIVVAEDQPFADWLARLKSELQAAATLKGAGPG